MIRIVIADDHTIMREGLKRILDGAEDIEVVGEAADGYDALAQVRKVGFDLLMLELSMSGRSGVELIHQIKDEAPKLPVLILTMHEEELCGTCDKSRRAWLSHQGKRRHAATERHQNSGVRPLVYQREGCGTTCNGCVARRG